MLVVKIYENIISSNQYYRINLKKNQNCFFLFVRFQHHIVYHKYINTNSRGFIVCAYFIIYCIEIVNVTVNFKLFDNYQESGFLFNAQAQQG